MNSNRILIDRLVRQVWRRAWAQQLLHALWWALLIGAGVQAGGALLGAVWQDAPDVPWWIGALPAMAAASVVLIRNRMSRVQAAHTVDRRLHLKDRVVSAREFAHAARPHPVHDLQLADTAAHLAGVRASAILPWRWRRDAGLVAAAALLCVGARMTPGGGGPESAVAAPAPPALVREALGIAQSIEELADVVDGETDAVVKDALEEIRGMAEAMRAPGAAMDEAFELMGRMRAELQRAADALDLARHRAVLEAWANALNASPHTQPAGQALAAQEYAEAAEAMEQLARDAAADIQAFANQSGALQAEAASLGEQASEAGLSMFAESLQKLAAGIRGQDAAQSRDALQSQAGQMRRQGMREALAQQLQQQWNQLAEAGQRMAQGYCAGCLQGEGCDGSDANCPSSGMSLARGPSDQLPGEESNSIGLGESTEPFGELTALDADLDTQQLRGQQTAGPSQVAVEQGAPILQEAALDYRDVYSRYRKLSDAVLAQEALPSGYQPVIRRYFESIRPRQAEPDE